MAVLLAVVLSPPLVGCSGTASGAPPGITPPHRPSGVRVLSSEEFYEVTGRTAGELTESMRANGPGERGALLVGRHLWSIDWGFEADDRGPGCSFGEARVTLRSRITMPRWRDQAAAGPALVSEWDRFVENLWVHQYGHRGIAYGAAEEVLHQLEQFERRPCDGHRAVTDRVRSVIAEYRALDASYDVETEASEAGAAGIYWPPAGAIDQDGTQEQ